AASSRGIVPRFSVCFAAGDLPIWLSHLFSWRLCSLCALCVQKKLARASPAPIAHNRCALSALRSLMFHRILASAILLSLCICVSAPAELVRWNIAKREPYPAGKSRGEVGPYEQWTGTVHFVLDPTAKANEQIVDLALAPRNSAGKVEFSADFRMLVQVDRSKASGTLFYEVNNRGGATAPRTIESGADDFLCRQGFIVLWSGWIAEVQPGRGRPRVPAAGENDA